MIKKAYPEKRELDPKKKPTQKTPSWNSPSHVEPSFSFKTPVPWNLPSIHSYITQTYRQTDIQGQTMRADIAQIKSS